MADVSGVFGVLAWFVIVLWGQEILQGQDHPLRKPHIDQKHLVKATRKRKKVFNEWVTTEESSFFDRFGGLNSVAVSEGWLEVGGPTTSLPTPDEVQDLAEHLAQLGYYLEQPLTR